MFQPLGQLCVVIFRVRTTVKSPGCKAAPENCISVCFQNLDEYNRTDNSLLIMNETEFISLVIQSENYDYNLIKLISLVPNQSENVEYNLILSAVEIMKTPIN